MLLSCNRLQITELESLGGNSKSKTIYNQITGINCKELLIGGLPMVGFCLVV